jgi:hypothetical protein
MSNHLNVWIGLAHVRPGLGASDEASDFAGAYVWVAGAGEGRDDFRRNVSAAVESDGYFLVELEDVATREQHATHDRLSEEMMSLD